MNEFSASIIYYDHTIELLDSTITSTFRFSHRIVFMLLCVLLIVGGVILGLNEISGIICVLMGAFLLPSVNSTKSRNARAILKTMQGKQLRMNYSFKTKYFECIAGESVTTHNYDSIIRLVEDADYFYLFQKKTQACMIDKKSVEPNDIDSFKRFISKYVGLDWTKKSTFLNFSPKKVRSDRLNTRMK